jgi:hypothetical protein
MLGERHDVGEDLRVLNERGRALSAAQLSEGTLQPETGARRPPMRIRLPRGRVLEGPMLAGFEKERERVEGMMNRKGGAPARVAQTVGN